MKRRRANAAVDLNEAGYPASWDIAVDPNEVDIDDPYGWGDLDTYEPSDTDRKRFEQEQFIRARVGDRSYGRRREPRIRQTTCSVRRQWDRVAGPFRTRTAAWKFARWLRDRKGWGKRSVLGVTPLPFEKRRKTRDWSVCAMTKKKATKKRAAKRSAKKKATKRAAKRTTKKKVGAKRRKNPSIMTVRNPSTLKKKAKRAVKRVAKRVRRATGVGSALAVLKRKKTITPAELDQLAKKDPEFRRALARFKRFHGTYPDSIELGELPVRDPGFRYAVALGDTVAHEYDPHRSSRRAGPPFRHRFKKGRQATVTDPDGKGVFVVKRKGSRLRVTERGIID